MSTDVQEAQKATEKVKQASSLSQEEVNKNRAESRHRERVREQLRFWGPAIALAAVSYPAQYLMIRDYVARCVGGTWLTCSVHPYILCALTSVIAVLLVWRHHRATYIPTKLADWKIACGKAQSALRIRPKVSPRSSASMSEQNAEAII